MYAYYVYIAHIHYPDAVVFTVSYQKQEMDIYSDALMTAVDLTMSFCVCNEQRMLKQNNRGKLTEPYL